MLEKLCTLWPALECYYYTWKYSCCAENKQLFPLFALYRQSCLLAYSCLSDGSCTASPPSRNRVRLAKMKFRNSFYLLPTYRGLPTSKESRQHEQALIMKKVGVGKVLDGLFGSSRADGQSLSGCRFLRGEMSFKRIHLICGLTESTTEA